MENTRDNEDVEIDLLELLLALKRRILYIIAAGLLGGCIAAAYTQFAVTPLYTSSGNMLVLTGETSISSLTNLQISSQLTSDYTILATSRPVLQDVIENLDLNISYTTLAEQITIENPDDTRIMEFSVTNADPELARDIVNELMTVASEYIGDKMEVTAPKIIEEGVLPTAQTSPSLMKNTALGLAAGVAVACAIIILITLLDDTIKSEDDIAKYLGLSTLAVIPDRQDFINSSSGSKKKKKKSNAGGGKNSTDKGGEH